MVTDYSDVSGSADKLYVLIDDPNQIDLITPILPKELYLNLTRDNLAMIMHKAATKFNGVLAVAEEFNPGSRKGRLLQCIFCKTKPFFSRWVYQERVLAGSAVNLVT